MPTGDALLRMVKQVCVSRGVSVISLSGYRSFALQLDKTRKHASGHDLELVAGALVRRYVTLGLKREVLEDISFRVFSISVPVADS